MTTLDQFIGRSSPLSKTSADQFLRQFGLARNPFPPARTIIPQVLYNQESAFDKFIDRVKELLEAEPQRRAMGITGGTGGGKTHFLRRCQYLLEEWCNEHDRMFVVAEFPAGAGSVSQMLREILQRADDQCRSRGEIDLLTAVVRKLRTDAVDLDGIKQSDLRAVVELLTHAAKEGFTPPDRSGQVGFDALREIAKRWLAGGTLTQTERKYVRVFSRLTTASMGVRIVSELLTFARRLGVIEGLFLCIDEAEALFTSGLSAAKVQSFLQDLRYLFDEAVKGGSGYSLLVLTASTQNGTVNLRDFNYPLYQRLGFEGASRAELQPIGSLGEARAFANTYIDYEYQRAMEAHDLPHQISPEKARSLISEEDIRVAFSSAADPGSPLARAGGRINQAPLLEALHHTVENKRVGHP